MSFVGKTASVFGVVGLSTLATLGVVESASAVTVKKGLDYLETNSGTFFTFNEIGKVDFKGNFIGMFNGDDVGRTDTIVERKNDVVVSGQTPIEVLAISLKSKTAVDIGQSSFDIFVNLTPGSSSTGTMIINDNGTFSSVFDVHFTANFKPVGGGDSIPCPVTNCNFWKTFTASGNWSEEPQPGSFRGPESSNFFTVGETTHDTGGGGHIVSTATVPEPLTILGSATALGCGAFLKRQYAKKLSNKDVS